MAPLVLMWPALLALTHPFAFFNHFFTLHPGTLHLSLSSLVCAPPAASHIVLYPRPAARIFM
jgi:hypothetical protein